MVTGALKSRKGAEERRDGGVGSGTQTVGTGEGLLTGGGGSGPGAGGGAASGTRRPPSAFSHHGHGPHLRDLNAGSFLPESAARGTALPAH